nr:formin-like protein 20 [Ipomoea batatas]
MDGSSVVVGYRGCLVVLDFSTVDSILKPALVTVLDLTCPFLCSHKLLDSSAMLQLYCTFVSFWTGWQSKKAKRRLRKPGTVPLAYAKVMKKLNFCG